ncbi:MAG TPA: ATP synthase F1 subunit delta [Erysipelotrichaceae bacterium]|nr:ATP synthase F1 subunit delta [Erysipelotrichaceae bacterium]
MTISTEMYAQALYEIGERDPLVFLNDLARFEEILWADKKISQHFLKTYNNFDVVFDVLKSEFSFEFINFLKIIYENRVFSDLANIKKNYERLLVENDHLTVVLVISAKELNDKNKESIIKMVKSKYKEPMQITYQVDHSLMGGYILRVNNDIYDTSLKSKLDQITNLEV